MKTVKQLQKEATHITNLINLAKVQASAEMKRLKWHRTRVCDEIRKLRMEQEGITEEDIADTMPPNASQPHTRNG